MCQADFNFDGTVGAPDLAQLLARWGICRCGTSQTEGSGGGGGQANAPGAPTDEVESASADALLNMLGFTDSQQFLEWSTNASPSQMLALSMLIESATAIPDEP